MINDKWEEKKEKKERKKEPLLNPPRWGGLEENQLRITDFEGRDCPFRDEMLILSFNIFYIAGYIVPKGTCSFLCHLCYKHLIPTGFFLIDS